VEHRPIRSRTTATGGIDEDLNIVCGEHVIDAGVDESGGIGGGQLAGRKWLPVPRGVVRRSRWKMRQSWWARS
jgi:hypothetical protein